MATNDAIGTSLYIDYSDFASGIAEANRLIKLNEQQFKTSAEGMDDWNKTSEGLNAKLSSLAKSITLQTDKVKAMENEYEKVKNQYGENSAEAQKYALKLEKERTSLAKLEKDQRKYKNALDEVEASTEKTEKGLKGFIARLKDTSEATEEAEKGASGLGASFKTLVGANLVSGAISGLVSSLGGLVSSFFETSEATREYRMNMAKVEQTALSMGESFDNAKENMLEMASVSGDLEATGEAINNLLASGIKGDNLDKITKQLTGASIKWKDTLKLEGLADGLQETLATNNAIGPFAELLERGGQNLDTFNSQIKACTTEAEKQNLVMSYLSKMGLEEITDGYYEANKSMIDAEKSTLRYNDTMAKLGGIMEPINTIITNIKSNLIESFLPAISTLAQGFTDLATGVSGATGKIAGGFMGILSTIGERIKTIGSTIITNAIKIVPDLMAKLSQAFPHIIGLITDYVNLGLVTAGDIFKKASALIPEAFSNLLSFFQNGFSTLLESLPEFINNFMSAWGGYVSMFATFGAELFKNIGEAVVHGIGAIKENLPLVVESITEGLKSFLPKVVDGATKMFNGLLDGLKKVLSSLSENLPSIIDTILDAIKKWAPVLLSNAFNLFKNIVSGLIKFLPVLLSEAPKIVYTLVEGVMKLAGTLLGLGKDLIISIKDGLIENLGKIKDVGKNLVEGLWNGISDAKAWILEKVKGFGDSILKGFKDFFGIHSPSTVMATQGNYLVEGLAQGLTDNAGKITPATQEIGNNVINDLKASIEGHKEAIADILGVTFAEAGDIASSPIVETGEEIGEDLTKGIANSTGKENVFENMGTDLKTSFEDVVKDVFSAQNMESLVSGDWQAFVGSITGTLGSALSSTISTAIGGIGGAIAGGLVGGIFSLLPKLFSQNKKVTETIEPVIKSQATGQSAWQYSFDNANEIAGVISNTSQSLQADRNRVTQIINFNQTNTSPEALNSAEIYRQTNRAVNLLGVKVGGYV